MVCKKCGADIADNAKFCGYCGETVETAQKKNETQNVETVTNGHVVNETDLGKTIVVDPITSELEEQSTKSMALNMSNNKKGKTPILVIVGIILAVIATGLLIFTFTNKSSNSIEVLKKTFANFEDKYDNGTITTKISMSASGVSIDLSADIKIQKISDKKAKFQVTANSSMLFKEMNLYAEVDETDLNMYLESTLIDMLGATKSLTPSWINYSLKLDELMENEEVENKLNDVKLEDVIDAKHFVYIDEVDGLKHYELIIDQELVEKIEEISGEKAEEKLEKAIKIDLYITSSNEISKIELDMSEYLEETDTVSNLVLSFELKDLNNTKVEIPSEAINSSIDLETYMKNNTIGYNSDLEMD